MHPREHSSSDTPYSFNEWREAICDLGKPKNNNQKINQMTDAIINANMASARHDEFQKNPQNLLTSLINDVQHLFTTYDTDYLINQHAVARFFMLKINLFIEKIQQENREVTNTEENKKKYQDDYNKLIAEIAKYTSLIETHAPTLNMYLAPLFFGYDIDENKETSIKILSSADSDWLQRQETTLYQTELAKLKATNAQLSPLYQSIKDEGNNLIDKIEANRMASEKPSCFFKNQPFDYKRQTLNLKKTNELLQNPTDSKKHAEYQKLIQSNKHDDSWGILLAMVSMVSSIVGGLVALFMLTPPLTAFLGGIGLTAAAGISTGAASIGITRYTRTDARLSSLFNEVKHIQEPAPYREEPHRSYAAWAVVR